MTLSRPPAALVDALRSGIQAVLGGDLVGLYLYGSSVSGGFDPDVSDIDLIAVTSSEAAELDLAGLDRMHRDVVKQHPSWDDRLEVVYVARAALWSFRRGGPLAVISPGEPLHVRDGVELWLQNWYLVRTSGVTLYGPDAATIVPPIARREFIAATARYADEVRRRSLDEASPVARAYAVLTICRALRTVRTKEQCSKQEGAAWVRQRRPEWAWLIDIALQCRLSQGRIGLADDETRVAAEAFVRLLADEIAHATSP